MSTTVSSTGNESVDDDENKTRVLGLEIWQLIIVSVFVIMVLTFTVSIIIEHCKRSK